MKKVSQVPNVSGVPRVRICLYGAIFILTTRDTRDTRATRDTRETRDARDARDARDTHKKFTNSPKRPELLPTSQQQ
jgi:hypothetical protein